MMRRAFAALVLTAIALCAAIPALAGGPRGVFNGLPVKYSGAGTVTLNYDNGPLGSRTKIQADAMVTEAVALWTNVATATVTILRGNDLPVDVNSANYLTYFGTLNSSVSNDGLSPVIYDSDGMILDTLFGSGAKNNLLGIAGSSYYTVSNTRLYGEGRAIINGYASVSDTTLKMVITHEIGHLIGMDHTQLDNEQGLASSSYPLMYPIAYRNSLSLHEDEIAAVTAIYPDVTANAAYGSLTGTFTQANGTPILGANLWAKEISTNKLYSMATDYLMQNTGAFKLLLPAGTYILQAGAIRTTFNAGSSVGLYAVSAAGASFQSPMYVGGTPMATLTLGNGSPVQFSISAGCAATASFKFDGTGSIGGNCVNNYTVSFNSNGGSAVSSQSVANNSTAILPAAPTKVGSTFAGWYADAGLINAFNFATPITGNITLYAKWTLNNYTVSFNSNNGSAVASQSVAYNGNAVQPAAPTKAGSTFVGWYSDAGLSVAFNFATAITGNLTLYAKWSINNYTVSFNSNGGSAVNNQIVPYNGNAASPAAPAKVGSTFAGWYSDAGLASAFNFSTAVTGDMTLYAKWTLNNYTVSFNSNGGSAVASQIVPYNGSATLPVKPSRNGFVFGGWYSDVGLNSPYNFSAAVTGDTMVYAKWTRVSLTPIFMLLLD